LKSLMSLFGTILIYIFIKSVPGNKSFQNTL
jgi:hypothetical protein